MRNSHHHILSFFALVTCAFLGPVLFGYALYPTGEDLVTYYYPIFDFFAKALKAHESFLWLPHIYSGFPVYVSQVGGFFDPVNIVLFKALPTDVAMHARLAFDLLLTMIVSYKASRAFGLSKVASLLVGPSYLLAFHWRFLSNPLIANTLFLLPTLLFVQARVFREAKIQWKYVALGAGSIGWALLCGYTQLIVYALTLTGIVVLGRVFLERWSTKHLITSLGSGLAMVALGVVIGLPQILPAAQFLALTTRAEPATYAELTLKTISPGDLLMVLVPDYFYVPYVADGKTPIFIGALWFVLALGGVILTLVPLIRRIPLNKDARRFVPVAIAFLFAFVAAVKWSPLYWFLNKLPVFEMFRFPFRFMFLGSFFGSLLAGYAFDNVDALTRSRLFRAVVYAFASVSVLFVVGIGILQLLASFGRPLISSSIYFVFTTFLQGRFGFEKGSAHYQDAIERGLDAYRELLSFTDIHVVVPLVLLILGMVLLVQLMRGKLIPLYFTEWARVLTIITVLVVPMLGWHVFQPRAIWEYPDTLARLGVKDLANYRIYSFLPGEAAQPFIPPQYKISKEEEMALGELQRAAYLSNGVILTDTRSIDGYDQFEPKDTLFAVGLAGGELAAGYGAGTPEERREKLLNNLGVVGMMAGKYIVSGMPLSSPFLKPLGSPAVSEYKMPFYVYENMFALPKYYIAGASVAVPHESFEDLSSRANVRFGREVYLDCTGCAVPQSASRVFRSIDEKNGSYVLTVSLDAPQHVVLSETLLPGWVATIDGEPADIIRANGLYMAVLVPAGEHIVRFEYRGMLDELRILQTIGLIE